MDRPRDIDPADGVVQRQSSVSECLPLRIRGVCIYCRPTVWHTSWYGDSAPGMFGGLALDEAGGTSSPPDALQHRSTNGGHMDSGESFLPRVWNRALFQEHDPAIRAGSSAVDVHGVVLLAKQLDGCRSSR